MIPATVISSFSSRKKIGFYFFAKTSLFSLRLHGNGPVSNEEFKFKFEIEIEDSGRG
jgi:hypothetical protein